MSVRDLLNDKSPNPGYYGEEHSPKQGKFFRRLISQFVIAGCIFAGIVYYYEQESKVGDNVRFVVAMVTSEDENLLAVNGSLFPGLEGFKLKNTKLNNVSTNDENSIPVGVKDTTGKLMLILPATGLMERGFGDLSDKGVKYDGIDIYCQGNQPIKAAAGGEITKIEKLGEATLIEINHQEFLQSQYTGVIEPKIELGAKVMQGAIIGYLNESTLNFKVVENGLATDPFLFLNGPE